MSNLKKQIDRMERYQWQEDEKSLEELEKEDTDNIGGALVEYKELRQSVGLSSHKSTYARPMHIRKKMGQILLEGFESCVNRDDAAVF